MRKGASYIIIHLVSALCNFLKLRHDNIIRLPCPFLVGRIRSLISFRPSILNTMLDISLFANSRISSFNRIPLVVSVKRNFLLFASSILLPYSTSCFTTSQFIVGSPPKKSTSRFFLEPELATKKSSAFYRLQSSLTLCGRDIRLLLQSSSDRQDYSHAQYADRVPLQPSVCL